MDSKGEPMTTRQTRTEKLDLRLTAEAKHILATAAAFERRSITDFVLDSALDRAGERLADRRSFHLDAERWQAFIAALDAPTRDLPRMRELLSRPSIFSGNEPA
jgi:uncharacterized protein (DUF1778 family)